MDRRYDTVGVGFGPSNLSLAIALQEQGQQAGHQLNAVFLEKKEDFGWFPEMLLDGATMQVPFLKDLVTLRNPQSPYSFLSYLQQKGRLEKFVNLRDWFPTRLEFHDYLGWAAAQFQDQVHYEQQITAIEPVGTADVDELRVTTKSKNSNTNSYLTRSLVLALGATPNVPSCVKMRNSSARIWHNANFLPKIASYDKDKSYHFAVVGGGQSAAEICHYLHTNYPNAKVTVIMNGFGFRAADDTEFVNEIFASKSTDLFFRAPDFMRQELLEKLDNTNYTAVDTDLIKTLYHLHYNDLVTGKNRLNFVNLSMLVEAREEADHVDIILKDRIEERVHELTVDALILATGYQSNKPSALLQNILPYLALGENNELNVDRHYRVLSKGHFHANIFVQGTNEPTHGLSDTLLSVLPFRSAEIAGQIYERAANEMPKEHKNVRPITA